MPNYFLSENSKIVRVVATGTDIFNTNPESTRVKMTNYDRVTFLLTGASSTGTATVTVLQSAASSGGTPTAIPFHYRVAHSGTDQSIGAMSAATASGFTTTAGVTATYVIEVANQGMINTTDLPYVSIKTTEVVNDPVAGYAIAILTGPSSNGGALPA